MSSSLNFRFSDAEESFRRELRAFLVEELPNDHWKMQNDREGLSDDQSEFDRAFRKKLAARGWLTLHWPKEYGGLGAGYMQQLIFNEEMAYFRAPSGGMGVQLAGPTIMMHGTTEQREKHLEAIASGDEVWCQGFSEPGSGSDLASLQTRAVRNGDNYVVNGQKIWTSGGHLAKWCMLLVRTNTEAPKHKGISFLLVDMESQGVQVRPLINVLGSHAFNEIFFENVHVPCRNLVGQEDQGWYVATTTLDYERSGISRIIWGQHMLEEILAYARSQHPKKVGLRNQIADLWISSDVARLLAYRVVWLQAQGLVPNYEASMAKLFSSEVQQRITRFGVNVLGLYGALRRCSPGRLPMFGSLSEAYMATLSYTIASGTSEIQRDIIARRGLELPRS